MAKLEVRRGVVEPFNAKTVISGNDNAISSTTVTTFELDGAVTEFRGGTLPFRVGDEAIVAGQLASSGIFVAYAVALPRQRLVIDAYSPASVATGSIFTIVGLGVGIGTLPGALDWLPSLFPLIITAILSLAFTGIGLSLILSARTARQAKLMVRRASEPGTGKIPA